MIDISFSGQNTMSPRAMARLQAGLLLFVSVVFGLIAGYSYVTAVWMFLFLFLVSVIYFRPMVGVYLIAAGMPFLNIGFKYNNPIRLVDEFIPIGVVPVVLTAAVFTVKRIVNSGLRGSIVSRTAAKFNGEDLFLVMIILFIVTSLLWTLDVTHGIVMIFLLACCFWIYRNFPRIITSEQHVRNIFWVILAISPALVTLLLMSKYYHDYSYKVKLFKDTTFVFFFHTIVASSGKIRLGGFAPVNIAANILGIIIFVMIYIAFRVGWAMRFVLAAYSAIILYCLIKTGSKAGLATLLLGIMVLLVVIPEFRKRLLKFIYAGVMIVGLFLVVAGQALLKRIELIVSGKVTDDRLGWWAKGFRHLYDSYFVGMGAGGFPKIIDPVPAAHSFYFSVLFDYGILGFLLFTGLIIAIFRKIQRMGPSISGDMKIAFYCLMAEMATLSVHAAVDADYIYVPFWLILGVILGIGGLASRTRMQQAALSPTRGH